MTQVDDVAAAMAAVGLTADQRVTDLTGRDRAAFRRLVGWDPGGPVVVGHQGQEDGLVSSEAVYTIRAVSMP